MAYLDEDILYINIEEKYKSVKGRAREAYSDVLDTICEMPTADVVQAVRCKDCAVPHNRWTGCPKLNGLVTSPEFYCSCGERRKEDAKIF